MGEFDFVGGGRPRVQRNAPQQIHNVPQPLVDQDPRHVGKPSMGGYDYNADDNDLPYMPGVGSTQQAFTAPQARHRPIQFIDQNNIGTSQDSNAKYAQTYQQMESAKNMGPRFSRQTAEENLSKFTDVLGGMGDLVESTTNNDDTEIRYGIKVAKANIQNCIDTLSDVSLWIPRDARNLQETAAPRLGQAAKPIINALKAYLATLEKML